MRRARHCGLHPEQHDCCYSGRQPCWNTWKPKRRDMDDEWGAVVVDEAICIWKICLKGKVTPKAGTLEMWSSEILKRLPRCGVLHPIPLNWVFTLITKPFGHFCRGRPLKLAGHLTVGWQRTYGRIMADHVWSVRLRHLRMEWERRQKKTVLTLPPPPLRVGLSTHFWPWQATPTRESGRRWRWTRERGKVPSHSSKKTRCFRSVKAFYGRYPHVTELGERGGIEESAFPVL